jgi:hypothetical protein
VVHRFAAEAVELGVAIVHGSTARLLYASEADGSESGSSGGSAGAAGMCTRPVSGPVLCSRARLQSTLTRCYRCGSFRVSPVCAVRRSQASAKAAVAAAAAKAKRRSRRVAWSAL